MADRDLSGRTLGEFVLLEKLGQGSYGAVYRAEQPMLERHVAVKVLRKNGGVAEQRFLREARLASRFDHPFAAHIYAFGVDEGEDLLWIAMELVQGATLSSWIEQHGPMPLEQFVPVFERIADAVQAAHEHGIVHRDLKPSNIMVMEGGSYLLPKLLDFGIAKVQDPISDGSPAEHPHPDGESSPRRAAAETVRLRPVSTGEHRTVTGSRPGKKYRLTRTGAAFGSRPYMSPEQWSNAQTVGPASDVYSLGVVAYEVLTGCLPYTAEDSGELYRKHRFAELPRLGDGFPRDLDRILGCALAKLPEYRYRSPLEMAAELREALQTQPREQLRSLAKVWNDRARSPTLLMHGGELLHTPTETIGELERAFVTASHRRTMHRAWLRRCLAVGAAVLAIGAVWYHGVKLNEATVAQAELEQGRAALLHNEPDAPRHLAEAYRHDPSPSTTFMLARALQPKLAEQALLRSSFGRTWWATFSPDGKRIVTTDDKNAQIWDATTYQLLFTLHHGDIVYQAVYNTDSSRLITACGDGTVRIWDAANGSLVRELRRDHAKPRYSAVAVSADNSYVAAIDKDGAVAHVWDESTGTLLAEFGNEALGDSSVAFSADGRWLATSGGNDVRIFDTGTWAQVLSIAGPGVRGLSWDPRGERILTGSAEGDASIWAIPSGTRVHHLREAGEPIDAVAYSADGRLAVTASRDGAEQIWDAASGKLRIQGNYLRGKILSVEFDPTSALVVAAGANGSMVVSDVAQGMPVTTLDGPRNAILVAHFDPSSRRVVGASWDGTARVWSASSPYRKWSSPPVSDSCDRVTSLEPDGRFLAVGCKSYPTQVWDTARDHLLAKLPSVTPPGGDFDPAYPAVSSAGDRAAIARNNTVEVYELPGGRLLHTITHSASVSTVAFASSGRDIVSGAIDGSLLVTRDNGAVLALPRSSNGIVSAGFLTDGRIVAADAERRLRIYGIDGAALADLETPARVRMLRMSADSRRLVTVPSFTGEAAAPTLWDLERYRAIAPLDDPGQGQVYSARFTPGGRIVTACGDGAARLWDGAGVLLQTYQGGSRFLADVTSSSDGSMIVAGGGDGLLRFWDVSSGRLLWAMPAHRSYVVGVRTDGNDIVTRGFSGDLSHWTLPNAALVIEACSTHGHCAIVPK